MPNLLSLCIFTLMLAAGQALFKSVGMSVRGLAPADALMTAITQPLLYVALTLYGAATVLWIWILSRVPLSQAYPWVAIGAFLVPLLGWWLYHERPAPVFWLGVLLIMAGVWLTQYGSHGA